MELPLLKAKYGVWGHLCPLQVVPESTGLPFPGGDLSDLHGHKFFSQT